MKEYAVVIIGGGPAGSSCAHKLVQAGVECLVLDKETFPRQKTCAGWIPPYVFEDLGISPADYPFSLTEFPRLKISLAGIPVPFPGRQFAIRRMEFDSWLLELSGAKFKQHEVKEIRRIEGGFEVDGILKTRVLVGAGGTHCPAYRIFRGSSHPRKGTRIVALESEYQWDWTDPTCRLWFFENRLPGYFWYVPKKGGYVNIGVGGNAAELKKRGMTIQEQWDYLIRKLIKQGQIVAQPPDPRGYVYYLRDQADPPLREKDLYLIGDAAGLATLDMGEGIGPAIKSGQLAAAAILGADSISFSAIPKYSLLPVGLRWLLS